MAAPRVQATIRIPANIVCRVVDLAAGVVDNVLNVAQTAVGIVGSATNHASAFIAVARSFVAGVLADVSAPVRPKA
jgi:prophage DNA circulation protein